MAGQLGFDIARIGDDRIKRALLALSRRIDQVSSGPAQSVAVPQTINRTTVNEIRRTDAAAFDSDAPTPVLPAEYDNSRPHVMFVRRSNGTVDKFWHQP